MITNLSPYWALEQREIQMGLLDLFAEMEKYSLQKHGQLQFTCLHMEQYISDVSSPRNRPLNELRPFKKEFHVIFMLFNDRWTNFGNPFTFSCI